LPFDRRPRERKKINKDDEKKREIVHHGRGKRKKKSVGYLFYYPMGPKTGRSEGACIIGKKEKPVQPFTQADRQENKMGKNDNRLFGRDKKRKKLQFHRQNNRLKDRELTTQKKGKRKKRGSTRKIKTGGKRSRAFWKGKRKKIRILPRINARVSGRGQVRSFIAGTASEKKKGRRGPRTLLSPFVSCLEG